jgi:hypothetical protein
MILKIGYYLENWIQFPKLGLIFKIIFYFQKHTRFLTLYLTSAITRLCMGKTPHTPTNPHHTPTQPTQFQPKKIKKLEKSKKNPRNVSE